jgi:hypothetical protein
MNLLLIGIFSVSRGCDKVKPLFHELSLDGTLSLPPVCFLKNLELLFLLESLALKFFPVQLL